MNFNQIPISKISIGGVEMRVKGEVSIENDVAVEVASDNELGSETKRALYVTGQNANITVNLSEVDYNILQAALPFGADVDGDESAIGYGTSSCINLEDLAQELIITPKCSANAPIVSITAHKAVVEEGFDWTLAESHESIELTFTLLPDDTQTVPGTYDKEGELLYRVDIS